MGSWVVAVWVATQRPPTDQHLHVFAIDGALGRIDAELLACQWAACIPGVVMPTRSFIIERIN